MPFGFAFALVCVCVVGVISCVLLQQNKTTYKYILSANPQWNALRIELVGRQRRVWGRETPPPPTLSLQFESNCTISCGQKCQREDFTDSPPLSLYLSLWTLSPVCLAFGFWQRLCCLPLALTYACYLARTFNDTLRLWRLLVLLRFLNAHLARRICCPPWQTVLASLSLLSLPPLPSLSALFPFLFALPFVPDAVFNCFASVYLLFIYVSFHLHCLFSVAYAAAVDDQADNLIVSLCLSLPASPLLPLF